MSLESLRYKYGWPEERPILPGKDGMGWLTPGTARLLTRNTGDHTSVVVECGSWLGLSARHILRSAKHTTLICVDHWLGSVEHHGRPHWASKLPTLYDQFLYNMWEWKDRLIPLRSDTLDGLREIAAADVAPDLVYLDSSHDTSHVLAELRLCHSLWPCIPIVADDYSWKTVRSAIHEFSEESGREVVVDDKGSMILA